MSFDNTEQIILALLALQNRIIDMLNDEEEMPMQILMQEVEGSDEPDYIAELLEETGTEAIHGVELATFANTNLIGYILTAAVETSNGVMSFGDAIQHKELWEEIHKEYDGVRIREKSDKTYACFNWKKFGRKYLGTTDATELDEFDVTRHKLCTDLGFLPAERIKALFPRCADGTAIDVSLITSDEGKTKKKKSVTRKKKKKTNMKITKIAE